MKRMRDKVKDERKWKRRGGMKGNVRGMNEGMEGKQKERPSCFYSKIHGPRRNEVWRRWSGIGGEKRLEEVVTS